jgi:hypothetical protein
LTDHVEAPDVLRFAGVAFPIKTEVQQIKLAEEQRVELERLQQEMKEWCQNREAELDRYAGKINLKYWVRTSR